MSNSFAPNEGDFATLKGKVVVLTGGAKGIGAEVVKTLSAVGANTVFGDVDTAAGERLAEELKNVVFIPMDVTKYADHLKLFRIAINAFGRIDHAVPCAGINESGTWFDASLTVDSSALEQPDSTATIDINFLGTLYFSRVAVVFLRHSKSSEQDKSLLLISSVAGFMDTPGLFTYQASKQAVLGLLRTLRGVIYKRDGIRVNAVCPGITDTSLMPSVVIDSFRKLDLPLNDADHVAEVIVGLLVKSDWNGKAVCVESNRGWEFEDGLDREMPRWLGEQPTTRLMKGLEWLSAGAT